jgi:hypothetical protein
MYIVFLITKNLLLPIETLDITILFSTMMSLTSRVILNIPSNEPGMRQGSQESSVKRRCVKELIRQLENTPRYKENRFAAFWFLEHSLSIFHLFWQVVQLKSGLEVGMLHQVPGRMPFSLGSCESFLDGSHNPQLIVLAFHVKYISCCKNLVKRR